jgi:hypothetical protein
MDADVGEKWRTAAAATAAFVPMARWRRRSPSAREARDNIAAAKMMGGFEIVELGASWVALEGFLWTPGIRNISPKIPKLDRYKR